MKPLNIAIFLVWLTFQSSWAQDHIHLSVDQQLQQRVRPGSLELDNLQWSLQKVDARRAHGSFQKATEPNQKFYLDFDNLGTDKWANLRYQNGGTHLNVRSQRSQQIESSQLRFQTDLNPRIRLEIEGSQLSSHHQIQVTSTENRAVTRLVYEVLPRVTVSAGKSFFDRQGLNQKLRVSTFENGLTYHGKGLYIALRQGRERLFDGKARNNDSYKAYTSIEAGAPQHFRLVGLKIRPRVRLTKANWKGTTGSLSEQNLWLGLDTALSQKTNIALELSLNEVQSGRSQPDRSQLYLISINHQFQSDSHLRLYAILQDNPSSSERHKMQAGLVFRHRF